MQFTEVDPRDVIGLPEGFTEVDPSEVRVFGSPAAMSGGMRQVLGIASESDKAARAEADYLADPETLRKVVVPVPALAAAQVVQGVGGKVRQVGEVIGSQGMADWGRDTAVMGSDVEKTIRQEEPLQEGSWANSIRSGATSTYQQLPTMVAAGPLVKAGMRVAGLAASLVPMGAVTGGQSYQKYRERGFDVGTASAGSAVDELIEVGTELLPMDTALHFATSKAKFGLKQLAGAALKYNGGEYFGETLAMLGQDITDKYLTNPNLTPEQRQQKIDDYFTKINPETGHTEAWDNFTETLRTTTAQNAIMMGMGGVARRVSRAPDVADQVPTEQPAATVSAGITPATPSTAQNEAFDEYEDMPAPSGPLQKATELAAPVADPVQAPDTTEPLAAEAVETPSGRAVTEQDQAEFPVAREWAARQMDAGNKALWLQPGENQRDYAWRILDTYREVSKPRVLNDSAPVVQHDNEQLTAQEVSNAATGVLPDLQDQGAGQMGRQPVDLPAVQGQAEGVGSDNTSSGGRVDDLSSVQQEVDGKTQAVPTVRGSVEENETEAVPAATQPAAVQPAESGDGRNVAAASDPFKVENFLESIGVKPLSNTRTEGRKFFKETKGYESENGALVFSSLNQDEADRLEKAATTAGHTVERQPAQRADYKIVDGKSARGFVDVPGKYNVSIMPKNALAEAGATPLDAQAHEAATSPHNDTPEPTIPQIEAGNYKKGHVNLHGLDISIENPAGSVRKGIDETGKEWTTDLNHHYGYIKGTVGKDKDHVDVFIKPGIDQTTAGDKVFVVDQKNVKTGRFDEHKVMLGFGSIGEARQGYLSNYDKTGPQRILNITESTAPEFKQWLNDGDTTRPFARQTTVVPLQPAASKLIARRQLNPATDSLIVAVAKLGGISREDLDKQSGTAGDLAKTLNIMATKEAKAGLLHVISSKGKQLDHVRELLVEHGYLQEGATVNDLLDKIDAASRGAQSFAASNPAERAEKRYDAEMARQIPDGLTDEDLDAIGFWNWALDEQTAFGIVYEEAQAQLQKDVIRFEQRNDAVMAEADWQEFENEFREAFNADEQKSAGGNVEAAATKSSQGENGSAADAQTETRAEKPAAEVVSPAPEKVSHPGEQQSKLFATPPTFGKKPQPKTTKDDVTTSDLLDAFTSTESVQPKLPAAYGANNTLVSADRAAVIRAKLKAKFDNQINSGIDPEMLSLGTELAIFHIEAGVRKFSAFVTAISQDLDVPVHRMREYLRGWYNGARDTIEDKGFSIEGMDDSAHVREAHKALFEEKPAAVSPTRSPQRASKHREHLQKMLAAAKTEQGKANWKKRLEALNRKESEQPPATAIADNWHEHDNKPEPTFKKGDRIQTSDGEHGAISNVFSYTVTSARLDITRDGVRPTDRKVQHQHSYTARMDNGVEQSVYRFQPETDAAPEVVPAPRYNGKAIDPQMLLDDIKRDKDTAANNRAAASRARKASSIKIYNDKAQVYTTYAKDKQAVFDAWALEHPAEAIKYQKTAEITAVPPSAESTGSEQAPTEPLKMDIKETVHTKKGHKLFIVKMYDRVERDVYDKLNRDAKRTGNGWDKWSKGFQFLDRESAENFVEKWSGAKPEPVAVTKGPKVDYATFMSHVYHTLEENGYLHENARNSSRDGFALTYKQAYKKAVTDEMLAAVKRGEDVAEAHDSAAKNDTADLSDKFFDRARIKKPDTAELTSNQQRTIRDLGPVGTKVQFKEGFNNQVYEIAEIEPNFGKVRIVGEGKSVFRFSSDFKRAEDQNPLASTASNATMVNEKPATEGATNGTLRGNGENAAAVRESERTEPAPDERKPGRNDAGNSGDVQPAGKRSGPADAQGDREGKPVVSGGTGAQEHGGDVRQGDNGRGHERVRPVTQGLNFRITDEHGIGKGGAKQKARDNINAIRTLKKITAEERQATPEEQAVLVKYVDWGMGELANSIFENSGYHPVTRKYESSWFKEGWEELGRELKELLTAEEYDAAKKSTVSAFYTPIPIYRAMYDAAAQLGFTGGKILTPGSGLLHEAGTLPDAFLKSSRITGVELNPVSAAISKLLYPGHDIRHQGFEKFVMPDNFYDMAIGNPPFVDLNVTSDPAYAKYRFKLHDYFFAKSIDKVRPGGLLIFITSKGTMDKAGDKARAYLAERADLLGAIRLPETAFKENAGTETVTDVIFLRKRMANEQPGGYSWSELKEIKTPDGPAHINEYFAKHESMVLGKNAITSSQHGPKYTVLPLNGTPLAEQFDFAVRNYLPEKVYTESRTESPADRDTVEFDLAPSNVKEGAFYLNDAGDVLSKESGVGVPIAKKGKDLEVIRSFIPLRDAVRQVLFVQIKGGDLVAAQKDLKRQYDSFVKKHGPINSEKRVVTMRGDKESVSIRYPNFSPFRDDPDAYLVASIERYDEETGKATPTAIFTERTIKPEVVPQINSITDAMHVVMHEDGRIDIPKIAQHMGVTEEQAIDGLGAAIYRNPQTMQWETDDEYLSGNVKQKLALAEATAQADPSFARNVEALKAVQPEDLPPSRMSIGLGEPIVKAEYVEQFARDVVGMGIKVSHLKSTGDWSVEKVSGYQTTAATSDWGTNRRDAAEMIDAALNSRQIRIESYAMDGNGKEVKVFDRDATNAATEKMTKLKEKFSQWVWEHPDRSQELSRTYNDAYNNSVKRVYGGDHISKMAFPGMSAIIVPHEHQKRVAWRVVQSGNTYMAHSVGAGKTIGSILAGMELKRLGIKKKPMWVVPNHMLKQFASEFLQLYPAAKIIVADEHQFKKENRNRFMGRVAAENWDGVIITHTAFGKMQVSPEFSSSFIKDQIDELETELLLTDKGDRMKRKQIERAKLRLEQRLEKILSAADKDKGVTFEETGIDQLFVDEAHEFRKLDFVTNQTNIKGIDPSGSLAAFDLYVKSRYLEKLYPGRSLVLMSGTAITNTIGEIFTIQRFLQEEKLKELGLDNFDAWASTFGDMVTKLEATPAGSYKPVTRFAKFKKLSSLSQLWSEVGDFIHAKDLTYIKRPAVKTGGRILVTGEQSAAQKAWKKAAAVRIKAIESRKRPPQKGDDILLSVITDGRHVALDERYVNGAIRASKDNKLEKMVGNVAEIWRDTKKDKLTQMIFVDLGMPGSEERRGFSAYNQIVKSLVDQGIPEKEIAIMQNYKKSDEKSKLFKAMNEGSIRVLIGSSEAMGTGVNAQRRLVALHHLDPDTYLPSNIEQREGRIIRQGNSNPEVQLYAYVTKGSYDETMWQFLETKQRFIDQFLSGEAAEDEATDIDGGADSFAMARAMSSDNPLILERAGIESDIQRLESLRRAHFDDQQRLRMNVARAEENLPHYRKDVTALEKIIARRVDTSGDNFALTLKGVAYDERKSAGEALAQSIDKMLTDAKKYDDYTKVGEVAGLDIVARSGITLKIPWVTLEVGAHNTYSSPLSFQGLDSVESIDPVGVAMKLENMARSFDKNLAAVRTLIARDEKLIQDSSSRIGRQFEHAETLDDKKKRLQEIETILKAEEKQSDEGANTEAGGEDVPRFSHAEQVSVPLAAVKFDAIFSRITAGLKDRDRERMFALVDSFAQLPAAIQNEARRQGDSGKGVDGVFHRGKVYIVRENIATAERLEEVLFHEWHGHAGLKAFFGNDIHQSMIDLYHLVTPARLYPIGRKYGINLMHYGQGLARAGHDLETRRSIMTEEMLAHLTAEYSKGPIAAKVREVIGQIRAWLREHGFAKLAEWGETDIAWLLKKARVYAEAGAGQEKSDSTVFATGQDLLQRLRDKGITDEMLDKLVAGSAKFMTSDNSSQFVRAPNGTFDFGNFPNDMTGVNGDVYPAGPIRLEAGGDYGHQHIAEKRVQEFKDFGYADELDALHDIASNYTEVYEQPNGRLLLVKRNGRGKYASVELQKDGEYYGVTTWFLEDANPKSKTPYENRGGRRLLLRVAHADDSGKSPSFPESGEQGQAENSRRSNQSSPMNNTTLSDEDVKFSIRRDTGKIATTSTLDKIKHLLNPLDYSRFKETAVDRLPNDATMWLADNLGNPYWIKENNPGAAPFYEEAKDREVTRMDNNIRMFGGLVNNDGQRTAWEKIKNLGNWHEFTTAWGKLRRDQYDKLSDKQRAAYDVIRFEGDAYNKTYETLANALRNPRIKKAGLDAETFAFYRAALAAEEASFEEKLKIAADNMAEAGMDEEKIKGHIAEYRARYADLKGWVHRDHGEGDHVVRVYHTIDRLDFNVDEVQHKGADADRIRLPYFPGVELSRAMEKITEQLGGTFKQLRDGGIVMLFQKGQGEFALERFNDLQLTNKAGKYKYQVLVYNRFVGNAAAAKKLAAEVKGDLAAALPRNYYPDHSYATSWNFSNKLQEADFQELRTSDMKMEQVLSQAIDKAARKEGLDSGAVESIHEALVQNVAEALLGRGAGLYQIRRANYLIEGYDQTGAVKKYEDYINGTAGLFSKARYALRQFKNMKSVEPKLRNWATRYVADSLRNMGTGDRVSGNIRAVVSLWYLGFNTSWMLVNSTQPLVVGQAELSRFTKNAFTRIVIAEKDVIRGNLTEEEKGILQEHATLTQDRDSMMAEMTGALEGVGGKASKALHAVTQVSMALGQKVEVLNRHTIIIAAYRVFREQGLDREAAYRKALDVNSTVNIDMGRYNLPAWARGWFGRIFYALQSYIQHMLNYLWNRSSSGNRADQKAVLRLLFAMFLLGGAPAGAPGSDELDKLIQQIFGYSPKWALKSYLRKFARDYDSVGEALEGFVWHGIPGAFKPFGVGVSLTGATQLRLPVISSVIGGDDMFKAVGGPVSGLVTKGLMSYQASQRGDTMRSVEYLLPTALGNVASGVRQATVGVKTGHGKTVEYKGKPLKMEPQEAALRAIGLQPARTADISETRGKEKDLTTEWRDRRQEALDNYRMSRKMKYIQEFNRELRGSQAMGLINPITSESMQQVWGRTDKKKAQWEKRNGID